MLEKTISIPTDGLEIEATHFTLNQESTHKVVIIASATGVPRGYYSNFARHLFQNGYDVVSFDYRGMGGTSNVNIAANMTDWGEYDLNACINWCESFYDHIFIIGHSVGGQVFPFVSNPNRVKAAFFVASQSAYWRNWSGFYLLAVLNFWHVMIPVVSKIYGYLPSWAMGSPGGLPLPRQVTLDWRTWGLHPEGILCGKEDRHKKFQSVHIPVKFIGFKDDNMLAPWKSVKELAGFYSNAEVKLEKIDPSSINEKQIGHFGFFKRRFKQSLWPKAVHFLNSHS